MFGRASWCWWQAIYWHWTITIIIWLVYWRCNSVLEEKYKKKFSSVMSYDYTCIVLIGLSNGFRLRSAIEMKPLTKKWWSTYLDTLKLLWFKYESQTDWFNANDWFGCRCPIVCFWLYELSITEFCSTRNESNKLWKKIKSLFFLLFIWKYQKLSSTWF